MLLKKIMDRINGVDSVFGNDQKWLDYWLEETSLSMQDTVTQLRYKAYLILKALQWFKNGGSGRKFAGRHFSQCLESGVTVHGSGAQPLVKASPRTLQFMVSVQVIIVRQKQFLLLHGTCTVDANLFCSLVYVPAQ